MLILDERKNPYTATHIGGNDGGLMMREHGSLPRARKDGLLEETVGEELLLYDRDSHTAHCLSPIAAAVWRHCDGEHNTTELARLTGASESLVADALHELREKDLLAAEPALTQSTIPGISRREVIGRVARYGAAAAAGSLIVSATAATPAMASSGEEAKGCCQCYNAKLEEVACVEISSRECPEWCKARNFPKSTWHANLTCKGAKCE
jgi:hypothetical protein